MPLCLFIERGRVVTFVSQLLELCDYARAVFLECDSEPFGRGREDLAAAFAGFDDAVDD